MKESHRGTPNEILSKGIDSLDEVRHAGTSRIEAEIMMTAGPRKGEDTGLGEDACGVLLSEGLCCFWLADGTSDAPILEDLPRRISFSSRRLAQDLGLNFRRHVSNWTAVQEQLEARTPIMERVLTSTLHDVLEEWNGHLEDLMKRHPDYLPEIFSSDITFLDFSSTFLCGAITSTGYLQIACYGDSPFAVKRREAYEIFRPTNYRFFVRLQQQALDHIFCSAKEFHIQPITLDGVTQVIAGSDGVGKILDLIETQSKDFSFGEMRGRFHLYNPRTHDDKTLCIISLNRI